MKTDRNNLLARLHILMKQTIFKTINILQTF
nr:MAG TPA: hypothetical protein [Caudoviricetes sp.]